MHALPSCRWGYLFGGLFRVLHYSRHHGVPRIQCHCVIGASRIVYANEWQGQRCCVSSTCVHVVVPSVMRRDYITIFLMLWTFQKIYFYYVYRCSACTYVCVTPVQYAWKPEKSVELELQTVVSLRADAGNQTLVLQRATSALSRWAISPACLSFDYIAFWSSMRSLVSYVTHKLLFPLWPVMVES